MKISIITYLTGLLFGSFVFGQAAGQKELNSPVEKVRTVSQRSYEKTSYLVIEKLKLSDGFHFKAGDDGELFYARISDELNNINLNSPIEKLTDEEAEKLRSIDFELLVYPNPSDEFLQVVFHENLEEASVRLYSLDGRIISDDLVLNTRNHLINTSGLLNGNYVLELNFNGESMRATIVVQH